MLVVCVGLLCSLFLSMQMSMTAQAGNTKNYVNDLNGGIASILDPGSRNSTEVINATVKELNLTFPAEEEISSGLVMANVKDAVNVRSDASEEHPRSVNSTRTVEVPSWSVRTAGRRSSPVL